MHFLTEILKRQPLRLYGRDSQGQVVEVSIEYDDWLHKPFFVLHNSNVIERTDNLEAALRTADQIIDKGEYSFMAVCEECQRYHNDMMSPVCISCKE